MSLITEDAPFISSEDAVEIIENIISSKAIIHNDHDRTTFLVKMVVDILSDFQKVDFGVAARTVNTELIHFTDARANLRTSEMWAKCVEYLLARLDGAVKQYLCDPETGDLYREDFILYAESAFKRLNLSFVEILPKEYDELLNY